jgi:hypothetical protein
LPLKPGDKGAVRDQGTEGLRHHQPGHDVFAAGTGPAGQGGRPAASSCATTPIGKPFAEYLGRAGGDVVYDLEITPNRPD